MTRHPVDTRRARTFASLASIVAILVVATLVQSWLDEAPPARDSRFGQPVFEAVDTLIDQTDAIAVTLADERYTLVRTSDGWAMDTENGYPIRSDRLSTLADGLETLRWAGPRTRDPRKHDRIGVGDPEQGGNGALVAFVSEDGSVLTSMVTGRRAGAVYARRPEEQVAYRVEGDLPPFYSRDAWMDFAVVELAAETIGIVEIRDRFGDRLVLSRRAGSGPEGFAPAPPYLDQRLLTPLSAGGPALAMARFAPLDAKPASELENGPVAELITITFDGLEIIARAHDETDGGYITLRAIVAGNAAARARSINEQAEGWAFKLSGADYRDLTTPVSTITVPDF